MAETRLSDVDGERGRLVIAGHDVEALAGLPRFEDVCGLLWGAPADELKSRIGQGRARAFELLPRLGRCARPASGMDALRAALGHLTRRTTPLGGRGDACRSDRRLRGGLATCTFGTAAGRARTPRAATPWTSCAWRAGRDPTAARARALDAYLVTVSDHGMNASTFAARVVASTGSDMVSAVVAAVGALKGPLHGGAPGPVLDMLDAIGTRRERGRVDGRELDGGRRIMGMGHRVYRVRDPRAAVFERQIEVLLARRQRRPGGPPGPRPCGRARGRGRASRRHPDRPLRANVEFFTAVLLEAVGLPARGLLADVRRRPRRRLVCALDGAAGERKAHPPRLALRRPDAILIAGGPSRARVDAEAPKPRRRSRDSRSRGAARRSARTA